MAPGKSRHLLQDVEEMIWPLHPGPRFVVIADNTVTLALNVRSGRMRVISRALMISNLIAPPGLPRQVWCPVGKLIFLSPFMALRLVVTDAFATCSLKWVALGFSYLATVAPTTRCYYSLEKPWHRFRMSSS